MMKVAKDGKNPIKELFQKYLPKKDSYTMENSHHMGNLGGLKSSILIGNWLKDYYKKVK